MFKSRIVKICDYVASDADNFVSKLIVINNDIINETVAALCKEINIHINNCQVSLSPFYGGSDTYCIVGIFGYPTINALNDITQLIKQETSNKDPYIKGAPHDILSSH